MDLPFGPSTIAPYVTLSHQTEIVTALKVIHDDEWQYPRS